MKTTEDPAKIVAELPKTADGIFAHRCETVWGWVSLPHPFCRGPLKLLSSEEIYAQGGVILVDEGWGGCDDNYYYVRIEECWTTKELALEHKP